MQAFTTTKAGISRKSPLIQRLIFSKCEKILFKMCLRFIVFLGRMENYFAKMINYWGSTVELVIWHTSLSDTNRKRVFFLHEQSINDQLWVIRQLFADVFNELVNNVAGAPCQHQRSACFECDVCVECGSRIWLSQEDQNDKTPHLKLKLVIDAESDLHCWIFLFH